MPVSGPGRVLRRMGTAVEVDAGGQVRWCSALGRPEVRTGDWVLTQADLVLTILTDDEAAALADAGASAGGRTGTASQATSRTRNTSADTAANSTT